MRRDLLGHPPITHASALIRIQGSRIGEWETLEEARGKQSSWATKCFLCCSMINIGIFFGIVFLEDVIKFARRSENYSAHLGRILKFMVSKVNVIAIRSKLLMYLYD